MEEDNITFDYRVVINKKYNDKTDYITMETSEITKHFTYSFDYITYQYKTYTFEAYWNTRKGEPLKEILQTVIDQINKDNGTYINSYYSRSRSRVGRVFNTRDNIDLKDYDTMKYAIEILCYGEWNYTYYTFHLLESLNVPQILENNPIVHPKSREDHIKNDNIQTLSNNYNKSIDKTEIITIEMIKIRNLLKKDITNTYVEHNQLINNEILSLYKYQEIKYGSIVGVISPLNQIQLYVYLSISDNFNINQNLNVSFYYNEINNIDDFNINDLIDEKEYKGHQVIKITKSTGRHDTNRGTTLNLNTNFIVFNVTDKSPKNLCNISKVYDRFLKNKLKPNGILNEILNAETEPNVITEIKYHNPQIVLDNINNLKKQLYNNIELITRTYQQHSNKYVKQLKQLNEYPIYDKNDMLLYEEKGEYSLITFENESNQIINNCLEFSIISNTCCFTNNKITKDDFKQSELVVANQLIVKKYYKYTTKLNRVLVKYKNVKEIVMKKKHNMTTQELTDALKIAIKKHKDSIIQKRRCNEE